MTRPDGPWVLPFDSPLATETARSGGKGASLAHLVRAGFPVPGGAVVTADAYRAVVAAWPELAGMVRDLPLSDPAALRLRCAELREGLLDRPIPEAVQAAVSGALAGLVEGGPVGVRSSATLEDLAGAAFAGQHDSFLGVRGMASVLEHVRRCWASLWEDRAVRYRHEKGWAPDAADMAVVVQRMVPVDVAGVAFTMSPLTGETDRIVVTSAWGLGETVVSGEGEVDQFVVSKADGEVLERWIGDKTHRVVPTEAGTERIPVDEARRERPSLDGDELAALVRLARDVERHYAFPQDLEWGMEGGRLHLFQSRPVTEFPPRWTRQESAERFPEPITPLTWDFTTGGFHESLAHSLDLMGLPPFEGEWFARFDGYVYGNQTAVEVFTAGHRIAFDSLEGLAARVPDFAERYRWVQELPVLWARDLDRYLLSLGRLGAVELDGLDLGELWGHVLEVDAVGREYFLPNIAISITQGLLHRLLYRIVGHVVGPEAAAEAYDGLTCHVETKTGLVNRDLHELRALALGELELRELLVGTDRRTVVEDGLLAAHPDFARAFERFLEVHGHREVDFDAYHPTWSGQPWVVLENLRLMLLREDLPDPAERDQALRARQHATERDFLARVPEPLRNFVGEVVRLARAYTALDDLEHYETTRLTPPFRRALVAVGSRLVEEGALERPEDVFFLHRSTLEDRVAGRASADVVRREAEAGREAHARQAASEPPFARGGDGGDASAAPDGGAGGGRPDDGALRGLPGAPGVAEGPVCAVRSAEDFGRFPAGAVLVARTTNPAWTPLFYTAAAVVTESGGPLSHGAVTAREVRIPAVMAVRGALRLLEEGRTVQVDGSRGVVTLPDDGG